MNRVYVIGAGLAGLSAAVALTEAGQRVTLLEAGPAAGGRCRSYFDRELKLKIDNGNHLLLSGNRAAMEFIETIGAEQTLVVPAQPKFPFMDLTTNSRWTLHPNLGRVPWWVLFAERRVTGTRVTDYLALLRLARASGDATVAATLRPDRFFHRLVEPLATAVLNTSPERGLARLFGAAMRETLMQGGAACIPVLPRSGLSDSLIDPAIAWLQARGAVIQFGRRVASLRVSENRVVGLNTTDGPTDVSAVVLAVPSWVAAELIPGLSTPTEHEAILNIHFRVAAVPVTSPAFIGLVGGTAEWVFVKQDHVSVTISAANRLVDQSADAIAAAVWPDVRTALQLDDPMPPFRVVKERRATFAATAEQERLRPGPRSSLNNLVLAGDWTATGLPATIEGAIRSGRTAAEMLRSSRSRD